MQILSGGMFAVAWAVALTISALADDPPKPAEAAPVAAAGETVWRKIEKVPSRFPQVTDGLGCRWGATGDGAIGLSGMSDQRPAAFKQGALLRIDDKEFKASSGEEMPDGTRFRLIGTMGDWEVGRDVWIDKERGGVRWVETVKNTSADRRQLKLELDTVFDEKPESVNALGGDVFNPGGLPKGEPGLAVLPDNGGDKPVVVFLLADPKSAQRPTVGVWDGGAKVAVVWQVPVAAGQSFSVIHWILQRQDLALASSRKVIDPFFRNGRLIRPQLDAPAAAALGNFSAKGADDGPGDGPSAEAMLGALKKLSDRLGIDRGDDDVYWMSATSQLSGTVQGGALEVETRFGPRTLPMEDIAAVQGGGGRGRVPRVFLRDGTVLPGAVNLPGWKIVGAKGWTINLAPEALDAVVLKKSYADGISQLMPGLMVSLNSGEILPLPPGAGERISFTGPWGPFETDLSQVIALWHLKQPVPACRLWLKDGSKLTVFPQNRDLGVQSSRFGPITLNLADIAALWEPGDAVPDFTSEAADIADIDDLDGAFCLLKGGNLVAASLASESLAVLSGSTETTLKAADITQIRRADGGSELAPIFHLELASGGQLDGLLRTASVKIKTTAGESDVPVSHVVAIKVK